MSESSLREAIARALYEHHAAGLGGRGAHSWEEIVEGGENRPYPEYPHLVDEFRARADAVLAVLTDTPAYLALDLWMALGLSSRDFDAYLERNGWANTWANLLDGVRLKSGRRGCSKDTETPRERCVLIGGHVGPCMGASDVGSSERLPGAAFGGEQDA